jgi:tetratricopeptide (TPR) repeat protein
VHSDLSIQQHLSNAERLTKLKQHQAAQKQLLQGLAEYPDELSLLIALGHSLARLADWAKLIAHAKRLATHYPDSWQGHYFAALSSLNSCDLCSAEHSILAGLRHAPKNLLLLITANDIFRAAENLEASLMYAFSAIRYHPDKQIGYARASQDMFKLNQFDKARHYANKWLPKFPKSSALKRIDRKLSVVLKTRKDYPEVFGAWQNRSAARLNSKDSIPMVPEDVKSCIHAFQYWSQTDIPVEVISVRKQWNKVLTAIGIDPIQHFNKSKARDWIVKNAPQFRVSFDTAFHYAIEADVFRLAYASMHDCIWIDSDFPPCALSAHTLSHALAASISPLSGLEIRHIGSFLDTRTPHNPWWGPGCCA